MLPEPIQRWRLVLARGVDAPPLSQRETTAAWEAAVRSSELPFVPVSLPAAGADDAADDVPAEALRPRLAFGAALATGMAADAELLDILLAQRLPRWRVREALESVIPDGWRLIDLEDVWLGGPSIAGLVAGADYRVTVETEAPSSTLADACRALLAAGSLPREREKGGGTVTYDLRPLLLDAAVVEPGPPAVLGIRTRIHPSLGSGRPEEVTSALADALGQPVRATSMVRVRLLLADEVEPSAARD